MRDSSTNFSKNKNARKESAVFDVVEFGSSSRVSVLYNIVHTDNTGYFTLVDNSPKVNNGKSSGKYKKNKP